MTLAGAVRFLSEAATRTKFVSHFLLSYPRETCHPAQTCGAIYDSRACAGLFPSCSETILATSFTPWLYSASYFGSGLLISSLRSWCQYMFADPWS